VSDFKYVGNAQAQHVDAVDKVMGRAQYVGDLQVPGMLYAKVLRSPVPHARIGRLDVTPALQVPGVRAVITSEDFVDHGAFGWPVKDAFVLAHQKVRYVGDPIAAVAAESLEAAQAGLEAIILALEELPVVKDPRHALDPDAPLVPLTSPTDQGNLCATHIVRNQSPGPVLAGCPVSVDATYTFMHQEHAYLEPEGALAIPHEDGSLTIYANNQSPFINRDNTSAVLGLRPDQVRSIQPFVGAAFGGKDDGVYQCSAQAAKLALLTRRPVRLLLTVDESMVASYKREAMQVRMRVGVSDQGRVRAARVEILADSGAYASMTPLSTWRATVHAAGPYRYEAAHVDARAVYTNNGYAGACRGFGNTEATAASEMAIDELAHTLGVDPLDFRLQNALAQGDRAFTGNVIEQAVGLARCLAWVRQKSDWDRKRTMYKEEEGAKASRGVGVACYFHGCGLGAEGLDYANVTLEVTPDYTITLHTGLTDYGQGSRTVFTLLAAETLGVAPTRIVIPRPDTDNPAVESGPTVASRASILGGNATLNAARKLVDLLHLAAADRLQCDPAQILRHEECFIGPSEEPLIFEEVVDHARRMGFQLFARGHWQVPDIHWDFDSGTGVPYFAYTFGAQVAEVEVNRWTGKVRVTGVWAAHDAGKIIFPKGAEGQMIGGITQGIGYALMEGFAYQDGYPQQHNFDHYRIPRAIDVPEIETTYIETPLSAGPLGAKNLAEPVMIATTPAIANAVFHATGVRVRDFPISPQALRLS
jgi:CO/xanthine dehydrogenase Mo-binding subunit